MPRFFFDFHSGTGLTADDEGTDLVSADLAHAFALENIRSIVAEEARSGSVDLTGFIEVRDRAGSAVIRVDFVEAFKVRLPAPPERI